MQTTVVTCDLCGTIMSIPAVGRVTCSLVNTPNVYFKQDFSVNYSELCPTCAQSIREHINSLRKEPDANNS